MCCNDHKVLKRAMLHSWILSKGPHELRYVPQPDGGTIRCVRMWKVVFAHVEATFIRFSSLCMGHEWTAGWHATEWEPGEEYDVEDPKGFHVYWNAYVARSRADDVAWCMGTMFDGRRALCGRVVMTVDCPINALVCVDWNEAVFDRVFVSPRSIAEATAIALHRWNNRPDVPAASATPG